MPNVGVEVRRGVLCLVGRASAELREKLGLLGHVVELPDEDFDAATAVMGCAPAYLALAVEALADAGAADGPRPRARPRAGGRDDRGHRRAAARAPPGRRAAGCRLARWQHRGRPGGTRPRGRPGGLRGGGAGLAGEDAGMIALALSRNDVADYVSALFVVYIILIFANILISYIPRMPTYSPLAARGARLRHRDDQPLPQPLPPRPAADRRRRLRPRPQPDDRDHRAPRVARQSSSA